MDRGYVKLYRKSIDSQVFANTELWKVWTWCLMKATHKPIWVELPTGRGITEVFLQPGQFIFGRKTASKKLRMKPSSIRNRIKKLKNIGNLDIQPDTHFSIITVKNWHLYQVEEKKADMQEDRQRTGKGQPKDTYKNNKNNKNKEYTASVDADGSDFYLTRKKRKLSGKRLNTFNLFWESFNYKKGRAEAADSWLDIPYLTDSLVGKIIKAAKLEALNRSRIIGQGKTPKMAQGWLTGKRWEDEVNAEPQIRLEDVG
ncbi:MAG TPA: hypothetical protein VMW44_00985 [Candidatus Bathyarchaeia archaeon]|nr:hypothetical protein [Candidatus Bathyarchaeia archaeon]